MRRRNFLRRLAAFAGWLGFSKGSQQTESAALSPVDLQCEYESAPLGLDTPVPRLSWRLESPLRAQMQTAYRILVASNPQNLAAGTGDLWDSGKIQSDRSNQIDYQGAALRSFQRCYWKVRVWDLAGRACASSEPAVWEMGILDEGGWQAKWITAAHLLTAGEPRRAPLFRKSFRLRERPKSARAYICGLGYSRALPERFEGGRSRSRSCSNQL